MTNPAAGGRYVRDKKTGELTREGDKPVEPTATDQPDISPADAAQPKTKGAK